MEGFHNAHHASPGVTDPPNPRKARLRQGKKPILTRSLTARLSNSVRQLERAYVRTASNQLHAFLNTVVAQSGKRLSPAEAAFLAEAVPVILDLLEKRKTNNVPALVRIRSYALSLDYSRSLEVMRRKVRPEAARK